MKKNKVVVFYHDGRPPRIFVNPTNLSILQEEGDILVNPSMPKGVSPEHWRLKNGKIRGPVTIEKAFPEDKSIEPTIIRWFKPFTFISILGLFSIEAYDHQAELIQLIEKIKTFF